MFYISQRIDRIFLTILSKSVIILPSLLSRRSLPVPWPVATCPACLCQAHRYRFMSITSSTKYIVTYQVRKIKAYTSLCLFVDDLNKKIKKIIFLKSTITFLSFAAKGFCLKLKIPSQDFFHTLGFSDNSSFFISVAFCQGLAFDFSEGALMARISLGIWYI